MNQRAGREGSTLLWAGTIQLAASAAGTKQVEAGEVALPAGSPGSPGFLLPLLLDASIHG